MRRTASLLLILLALFAATQNPCAYGQSPLSPYPQLAQGDGRDFTPADVDPLGDLFPRDDSGGVDDPPPLDGPLPPPPGTELESIASGQPIALTDEDAELQQAWEQNPAFWAQIISSRQWFNMHGWSFQADLVLLHRTAPKTRVLGVDTFVGVRNAPLNAKQTSYRIEPGMRLTMARSLRRDAQNRDHSLEFTLFGIFDWESPNGLESISGQSLQTPLDPGFVSGVAVAGGFFNADNYLTVQSSSLRSFEINRRVRYRLGRDRMVMRPDGTWTREICPGPTPSFLFGFRVVNVDDRFRMRSTREGVDFDTYGGLYDVQAENNLVGLQIGGDWLRQEAYYSYGFNMKGGAYVNFAHQRTEVVSNAPGFTDIDITRSATDQGGAFFAELNFEANYDIKPQLALRTAVQMAFIQGIAVGTRQSDINFGSPPQVVMNANAFYLGLAVGFERVW